MMSFLNFVNCIVQSHNKDEVSMAIAISMQSCRLQKLQGGSNMTGTDLYVNKPHCAAAVRP